MSEQHKKTVRRVFAEIWNERNVELANELLTNDSRNHDPATPDQGSGPEGFKKFFRLYNQAFPDQRLTIGDLFAEGDKVVARWDCIGTHKGELRGMAPTGKKIHISGISIFRFSGDRIAEQWNYWDALGLMQQLGQMPRMEKKPAA